MDKTLIKTYLEQCDLFAEAWNKQFNQKVVDDKQKETQSDIAKMIEKYEDIKRRFENLENDELGVWKLAEMIEQIDNGFS